MFVFEKELVLIVQIESERAVKQAEDIACVAGVDVLFVGPADLSISLSAPLDYGSPRFVDALKEVLRACEKQGKRKTREEGERTTQIHE